LKKKSKLCAAKLRDGSSCKNVAVEGELCGSHARKAATAAAAELEAPAGPSAAAAVDEADAFSASPPVGVSASATPVASLRGELRSGLMTEEIASLIKTNIVEGLQAVKNAWFTCTNCKHKNPISLADLGTRVNAAEKLLDQLDGKLRAESASVEQRLSEAQQKMREDLWSCTDAELELIILASHDGEPPPPMKETARKLAERILADPNVGSHTKEWFGANLTQAERELLGRCHFQLSNGWSAFPDPVYEVAEQVIEEASASV
jgi:hypothetical protein